MPTVYITDRGDEYIDNMGIDNIGRMSTETRELLGDLRYTGPLEVDSANDIPISRDAFMHLLRNRYIEID